MDAGWAGSRDRHHGAAQPFGPVVGAKPAGEEAVAIGHVTDVALAAARGTLFTLQALI